jgi:hypothetical protein
LRSAGVSGIDAALLRMADENVSFHPPILGKTVL